MIMGVSMCQRWQKRFQNVPVWDYPVIATLNFSSQPVFLSNISAGHQTKKTANRTTVNLGLNVVVVNIPLLQARYTITA
jgi:hypothetical protein